MDQKVFTQKTQTLLNLLGANPKLTVDGQAGQATEAALLKQLQKLDSKTEVPPTGFGVKVSSRAKAIARYGNLSVSGSVWPRQSEWMTYVDVPPQIKLMLGGKPVTRIYCNKDMAPSLTQAFKNVVARKCEQVLTTFDGCLNVRYVRGTTSVSTHAYGLALDFNAAENGLGVPTEKTRFGKHPEFVKCFTDCGFTWGGNFSGRKDAMHFSYAWE